VVLQRTTLFGLRFKRGVFPFVIATLASRRKLGVTRPDLAYLPESFPPLRDPGGQNRPPVFFRQTPPLICILTTVPRHLCFF
jgi:hypothetical protein